MKTVVTKYEVPLMRSNANPRRYNDPFATMLAAVAAASFATISGPAAIKPATPATMQSNQQAPAILAWRTGDSFLKRAVISDSLIVVPPCFSCSFTPYSLLLTAHCPTAHCSLLTAHCLPLRNVNALPQQP